MNGRASRGAAVVVGICMVLAASCRSGGPDRPAVERRTGFASSADGTGIYYESAGRGPALVLIHGLAGNHAVWFNQTAALSDSFEVITLSQRGFAPSGGGTNGYEPGRLTGDLAAVMDACGAERAHIVGQSMGGWTALAFALEYPERTLSLVLADTVAGIFDEEIRAAYQSTLERARRLAERPPALGRHPALGQDFERERPELAHLYQALSSFGSPRPSDIASGLGGWAFAHERLAALTVPVLFLAGSEDKIFSPETIRRSASYVPGARVEIIEGSGHSPYFEDPEAWNARLRAFVGPSVR